VSAICLGLGGSPNVLGRQKKVRIHRVDYLSFHLRFREQIGEFVRNGAESGFIEIEL
jgi:hypothetical protein